MSDFEPVTLHSIMNAEVKPLRNSKQKYIYIYLPYNLSTHRHEEEHSRGRQHVETEKHRKLQGDTLGTQTSLQEV